MQFFPWPFCPLEDYLGCYKLTEMTSDYTMASPSFHALVWEFRWISKPSVLHHAAQLEDILKPSGYKWQQSCHMDGWTMMDLCFCQVVSFVTHCCYQPQGLHVFHSTLVQDTLSCCKRPPPDSPFVNDIKFGPFCLGANAFGWCIWNHAKPAPPRSNPFSPHSWQGRNG